MIVINAVGASEGISVGTLVARKKDKREITKIYVENFESEIDRYIKAKSEVIDRLEKMYQNTLKNCGEKEAELFKVHQMMLDDDSYHGSVLDLIKSERQNAEYAIKTSSQKLVDMFSQMEDGYMQSRAEDVISISRMLIDSLMGNELSSLKNIAPGSILFADELNAGEISEIKKAGVGGLITPSGSPTSHASILARVMGIPTIVGIGDQLKDEFFGKLIIIDGSSGGMYIEPDEETYHRFVIKIKDISSQNENLEKLRGKRSVTKDGKNIDVYANLNNPNEIDEVLKSDAEGIGLFRTEFLYLGRNSYPTEDEQFEVYKNIAQKMQGKKIIVRTLDIGSDKQEKYMNFAKEENPALGYRGIRVCLKEIDIFKTQLRAIYRASAFGNFSIMFPMITSLGEIRMAKKIACEVQSELLNLGVPFANNVPIGVMVETPSAAVLSDLLAKEADFFSIGTNDLTQYTLALDRQGSNVAGDFSDATEAVLRLIEFSVKNAHENGISVGVCGEMASDTSLMPRLLEAGVDEFSVSPRFVLRARERVNSYSKKI